LPISGYAIYALLAGARPAFGAAWRRSSRVIRRHHVAAILAAVELGLQPLLWSEGGRALYNPYGLEITVPAMLLAHLTVAASPRRL